ncbi:MAG: gas vesicle protein K [Pseudomonadota bacterium]
MTVNVDNLLDLNAFGIGLDDVLSQAKTAVADDQGRIQIDPENVERDLAKLVLVVVELLRRLMEHQALARMDRGTLSEEQIDALSDGLYRAKAKIDEMRKAFGIPDDQFNIDLGALGSIL